MQTLRRIPYYGSLALMAYMPFHVFLVQSLSLVTGGLPVWKLAKDVVTILLLVLTVGLVYWYRKNTRTFSWLLSLAAAYGVLHLAVWAINPDIFQQTAILGTLYNNRLSGYLIIGLGAVLLRKKKINESKIISIVLIISTIVCLVGILQYFLPKDIMSHFGYSLERGARPAFFIDDKPDLPRIISTLRDPNSLGAFLILPITLLVYRLFHSVNSKRMLNTGLLGLHVLALLLTFSRSAWLGTVLSVGVFCIYYLRKQLMGWLARYWLVLSTTILIFGGLIFVFRDQYVVQNVLIHSDENTTSQMDSNAHHIEFAKRGLRGIWREPLGHGPGTAGIVSIQNPRGGMLIENYYIQIGYEVGVLGLLVFIAIHVLVYRRLLKAHTPLTICLLASFWGYVVVNMLLHAWTNEAVAAQWWLLAGIGTGLPIIRTKKS